jgi:hypothetical protein
VIRSNRLRAVASGRRAGEQNGAARRVTPDGIAKTEADQGSGRCGGSHDCAAAERFRGSLCYHSRIESMKMRCFSGETSVRETSSYFSELPNVLIPGPNDALA